ncbi:MAG: Rieske (2Fe-2S) protein [Myxococcales bacterium]|nr:Rieske (2Fe-2S) protein [Myxococcales bacterium]
MANFPVHPPLTKLPVRREFICQIGVMASAVALLPLTGCEVSELRLPKPVSATLEFDLAKDEYKALVNVGGKAKVTVGGQDIALIRASPTEIIAFQDACAHQQCSISENGQWDATLNILTCTCHQAKFAKDGKVVGQPTDGQKLTTPMKMFKVTFSGTKGSVAT